MSGSTIRLALLGALLVGVMAAALNLFWPIGIALEPETRMDVFVALLFAGVVVYGGAIHLVLRHPPRTGGLGVVLCVALLMRAMLLPAPPLLSSDIFRYVWDGRMQAAGINPYAYRPADPTLARYRDDAIYPFINRRDYARTIYPPAAQVVFAAVGLVGGGVLTMKLVVLAFEALGMACMLRLLWRLGLPRERVLIYAWNPLPLWAFACDGHVDGLAVGWLGLALLFGARRREVAGGMALAAAGLTKFLPFAVAPAFGPGRLPWRWAAACLGTVVGLYGLYASAGLNVLGFLSGYGSEEGLVASGDGFWLVAGLRHLVALPPWASLAYASAVLALYLALALALRARAPDRARPDPIWLCRSAGALAAYATAAISPHYAWYFAWLTLPCVVAPSAAVLWLGSASVLLYIDPLHDRFLWPTLVYGPALALVAWDIFGREGGRQPAGSAVEALS